MRRNRMNPIVWLFFAFILLLVILVLSCCQKDIEVVKGIGYAKVLNAGAGQMDLTVFSGISIVAHEIVPDEVVVRLPEGEYSFTAQWRKEGMIFTDGTKAVISWGDTTYIRLTPY